MQRWKLLLLELPLVFVLYLVFLVPLYVFTAFFSFDSVLESAGILFILYIFSFLFQHFANNKYSFYIYEFFSWLFGFASLVFIPACAILAVSWFFSWSAHTTAIVSLIAYVLLGLASIYSSVRTKIVRYTLHSDKVTRPYKIVQLSDLHIYGHTAKKQFDSIYDKALELKPDVITITGDLCDNPGVGPLDFLKRSYPVPTLCTLGNHDLYVGKAKVVERVSRSSMRLLSSSSQIIGELFFAGFDDSSKKGHLKQEISKINWDPHKYTVILYHRPWDMEYVGFADLMLTGHTHAGQIWPFWFFVRLQFDYVWGLFELGNLRLYNSSGSSTWGMPFRFGSRNEIVEFVIEPLPVK
jgi:uncharacterized protein